MFEFKNEVPPFNSITPLPLFDVILNSPPDEFNITEPADDIVAVFLFNANIPPELFNKKSPEASIRNRPVVESNFITPPEPVNT